MRSETAKGRGFVSGKGPTMSRALDQLLSILDIERLEENLFRGLSPQVGWQRVFGGQVIGQALVAAHRTVNGRLPHSRRRKLHYPPRGRRAAWPGDLLHGSLLPQRGDRA